MGRKRRKPSKLAPPTALPVPTPRPRNSPLQTASIVVRNLLPLLGLWWTGGSVENFLLLGVFNIAFAIACIACIGVAVSTRATNGAHGTANELAAWLTLAGMCLFLTVLLTALFGWVIALLASRSPLGLWNAQLGWLLLATLASALPGLMRQYQWDAASGLPEDMRKRRDQPLIAGLVLSAGLLFVLSGQAADWGRFGVNLMAVAVTALALFRDLRPDLLRRLVPLDGRRAPTA